MGDEKRGYKTAFLTISQRTVPASGGSSQSATAQEETWMYRQQDLEKLVKEAARAHKLLRQAEENALPEIEKAEDEHQRRVTKIQGDYQLNLEKEHRRSIVPFFKGMAWAIRRTALTSSHAEHDKRVADIEAEAVVPARQLKKMARKRAHNLLDQIMDEEEAD